ncbi:hypothetical protein [Mycolicibacterium palauense]|uniref:hypothetical protein n=1 Tax=Mycolicibacterium palauense TaxID=2034511 RepID=UPI001145ED56|nr:hypothetical protein [Mycolicibacterium palauense]
MNDRLNTPTGGFVVKYDGGTLSSEIGDHKQPEFFARTLRRFNGVRPWALTLCPLHGKDDGAMLRDDEDASEFLQAAGHADAMTIEIRTHGGEQWGIASVCGGRRVIPLARLSRLTTKSKRPMAFIWSPSQRSSMRTKPLTSSIATTPAALSRTTIRSGQLVDGPQTVRMSTWNREQQRT